jgi:hypothetical protein
MKKGRAKALRYEKEEFSAIRRNAHSSCITALRKAIETASYGRMLLDRPGSSPPPHFHHFL